MPRSSAGTVSSSGWKYEARLNGKRHAFAQRSVAIVLRTRTRAVVNVEPEHVAYVVQRVATVELILRIEHFIQRRIEYAEVVQPFARTRIARRFGSRKSFPGETASIPTRCAS